MGRVVLLARRWLVPTGPTAQRAHRRAGDDDVDDDALLAFLDAGRMEAAADARRRTRRERVLAAHETSLVGVLREVADRGCAVRLRLSDATTVTGAVRAVGRDVVAVTGARVDLVALRAVDEVQTTVVSAGGRGPTHDVGLREVLDDLADGQSDVALWLRGGRGAVRGRLLGSGIDVVTLRGDDGSLSHVPVPAIVAVTIG